MNAGKQASWVVVTAIAAVEVLKDQGVARWNYPLRLLHKEAVNHVRTISVPSRPESSPSSPPSSSADYITSNPNTKPFEKSFEKAMGLSCFGPTTVRF